MNTINTFQPHNRKASALFLFCFVRLGKATHKPKKYSYIHKI